MTTEKFQAFANDTQGLTLTDSHGNEFTVQNDPTEIAIYGQWQGSATSPDLQALVDVFTSIRDALASVKSTSDSKGITVSKKKDEISLDPDIQVTKDAAGLAKAEGFLAQLDGVKAKLNKAKP